MENFIFRGSWLKTLMRYTPNQQQQILFAMDSFVNEKPLPHMEERVLDLWEQIEPLLRTDKEKYEKNRIIKRENGKKGGAPKGNQNARKQPKTTEIKQNKLNNLIDIDIDKDIDNNISSNIEVLGKLEKTEKSIFLHLSKLFQEEGEVEYQKAAKDAIQLKGLDEWYNLLYHKIKDL